MKRVLGFLAVTVALLTDSQPSQAQATKSEMLAFPMPPASGYAQTKNFSYVGDYGYYLVPPVAQPGGGVTATDYTYVRYTGVTGKKVWIYGSWGNTAIPAAVGNTDACGHTHNSFGVWGRYEFQLTGLTLKGWTFLGGGSQSGQRDSNGKCVLKVDNPYKAIDNGRFSWGQDFLQLDLTQSTYIKELVIGVQSNTHGWGTCSVSPNAFKACKEPAWSIAYTLP
jgi:hypothetical protein